MLMPGCVALQGRLELNASQVAALKAVHTRLTDQLLNVTAERLHVSNMLQACHTPPEPYTAAQCC